MTCRPDQFHLWNAARRRSLINGASKLQRPHGGPARYPGDYHARSLSARMPPLWREGGEYKTRKGNKPACLWSGFEPPATSAVVESRFGGAFNADHRALP